MKFIIEHLSKQFDKKEVLRDIDFTFESGKRKIPQKINFSKTRSLSYLLLLIPKPGLAE